MVLKISLITVAINVAGSLSLMPILGHVGLALATSVSGTMAAAIMLYLLVRQRRLSTSFLPACGKTIVASSVMGLAIIFLQFGLERFVMLPAAISLTFIVAGGAAVYAVTAYVIGAVPADLLNQSNDRNT